MKIERLIHQSQIQTYYISDIPSLDPITLITIEPNEEHGKIIVECFGRAWAAYFSYGSVGGMLNFVSGVSADYLASKFCGPAERGSKREMVYLERTCQAVVDGAKMILELQKGETE